MIKIVADSSCDIRDIENRAQEIGLEFPPLTIRVGEEEFVDNDNINVEEMYRALANYDGKSSTACPSPEDYEKSFEGADEIYVITISSNLSGSYNAANLAKEMHLEKYPNKKICVFDSLSTSGTMALAMEKINELVKKKEKFEDIAKKVEDYMRNNTNMVFVLHSVANLVKNGRLNKIVGSAINVLGIKIVGRASDVGTLEPFGKVRSASKIVNSFIKEMIDKGYNGGKVLLSHANNITGAQSIKEAILDRFPKADVKIVAAKGLVSYYAEEKGILMGYECN